MMLGWASLLIALRATHRSYQLSDITTDTGLICPGENKMKRVVLLLLAIVLCMTCCLFVGAESV